MMSPSRRPPSSSTLRRLLRTGWRIGLGTTAAVTTASSAATLYLYQTDESYKRLIDFHILFTPMCWDYFQAFQRNNNKKKKNKKKPQPSTISNYNNNNINNNKDDDTNTVDIGDDIDDDDDTSELKLELERLHKLHAPLALKHILDLGGYYVKCAQMFCGMNLLPDAYEEEFSCLLDQVPVTKPFHVIQEIILTELGGDSLDDHFLQFDETPIAAASIGQVHCATMLLKMKKKKQHGTTTTTAHTTNIHEEEEEEEEQQQDVVVKVQYPEVERFFRLDVLGMKNLCDLCILAGIDIGIDPKSLDSIFEEFTKSFEEEFDYRREAANLKLVRDNLQSVPRFASQVIVPKPIDEKTTRKVLTMERIRGEPIKKRMKRMMEEWAAKEGKSVKDFEAELKSKFEDPVELQKILSQKPPSSAELFLYRSMLRVSDVWANVNIFLRNHSFGKRGGGGGVEQQEAYRWSTLPLDASHIATLLYDVHAHQLFVDGAFNADPHAGNVLICDDDNSSNYGSSSPKLGLVDFGNVQRIPDKKRRVSLAKFYLAMAKDCSNRKETWNDSDIATRFAAVGGQSKNMDIKFLAANALLMYDIRYDKATLERFGIEQDLSNITDVLYNGDDSFTEFPSDLVNLQRLAQTLVGVASVIGAGQPSCARMWRRQCEELVADSPLD